MGPADHVSNEVSIADLLRGIVRDVQDIIRAEGRLARAEIREDVRAAVRGVVPMAASFVAAWFGVMFALLAVVFALALIISYWAAAVTAALLLIAAAVLYYRGRKRLRDARLTPLKTVESVKENIEWAKSQMR